MKLKQLGFEKVGMSNIYYAQALNNTSPDHLAVDGKMVKSNAPMSHREKLIHEMGRVQKASKKNPNDTFIRRGSKFNFEFGTNEIDRVGRTTSVLGHADIITDHHKTVEEMPGNLLKTYTEQWMSPVLIKA